MYWDAVLIFNWYFKCKYSWQNQLSWNPGSKSHVRHSPCDAVVRFALISLQRKETWRLGPWTDLSPALALPTKITSLWSDPTIHSHTELSHSSTYVLTQFPLIFSTAHSFFHTISKPQYTGSRAEIGEEIRNTLLASRVKTFATVEQKALSGEISRKRKNTSLCF